jgi:hypothetical protein
MAPRRHEVFDARELRDTSAQARDELARRASDIEKHCSAVAEKLGQLYMRADALGLPGLTRSLDEPMRNASELERTFAALLHELQVGAQQRSIEP